MIRRGFWLLLGATLGVTGYRKVSRLAKVLSGSAPVLPDRQTNSAPRTSREPVDVAHNAAGFAQTAVSIGRNAVGFAREAGSFVRDVREGIADYHDLHSEELGRRLGGQRDRIQSGACLRGNLKP